MENNEKNRIVEDLRVDLTEQIKIFRGTPLYDHLEIWVETSIDWDRLGKSIDEFINANKLPDTPEEFQFQIAKIFYDSIPEWRTTRDAKNLDIAIESTFNNIRKPYRGTFKKKTTFGNSFNKMKKSWNKISKKDQKTLITQATGHALKTSSVGLYTALAISAVTKVVGAPAAAAAATIALPGLVAAAAVATAAIVAFDIFASGSKFKQTTNNIIKKHQKK